MPIYATHAFKARSPQDALRKARAFHDEHTDELIFQSYDGGHPSTRSLCATPAAVRSRCGRTTICACVSQPAICWMQLELCADCLADLARLDDGTPSISALDQARAAIARAKGLQP